MRTLVLNAGYEPLSVVSHERALVLVLNHRATIIEIVPDEPVRGIGRDYERPAVILLVEYVRMPARQHTPVTRRGVLRRDRSRCAYCQSPADTIDHVLPRSRGGAHSWENLVACCFRCNNLKSDRTPAEMGWSLSAAPMPPRVSRWSVKGTEQADPVWEPFLQLAA